MVRNFNIPTSRFALKELATQGNFWVYCCRWYFFPPLPFLFGGCHRDFISALFLKEFLGLCMARAYSEAVRFVHPVGGLRLRPAQSRPNGPTTHTGGNDVAEVLPKNKKIRGKRLNEKNW